jgi:hypothetical protein
MAVHSDIIYAILSLDSYNRGYDAGIIFEGSDIGGYTIGQSSTDLLGLLPSSNVGFYAQVYTYGTEKIISFRGTDNILQDSVEGWFFRCGLYYSASGHGGPRYV